MSGSGPVETKGVTQTPESLQAYYGQLGNRLAYLQAQYNASVEGSRGASRGQNLTPEEKEEATFTQDELRRVAAALAELERQAGETKYVAPAPLESLVPASTTSATTVQLLAEKRAAEAKVYRVLTEPEWVGIVPLPSTSRRTRQGRRPQGNWWMDREMFSAHVKFLVDTFEWITALASRMGLVGGQFALFWPAGNGQDNIFNLDDMEDIISQYSSALRHLKDIFAESKKRRGAAPSGVTSPIFFGSTPLMAYVSAAIDEKVEGIVPLGTEEFIYLRNGLALSNTLANILELSYTKFNLKLPTSRNRLYGMAYPGEENIASPIYQYLGSQSSPMIWAVNPDTSSSKRYIKVPNTKDIKIYTNLEEIYRNRNPLIRQGRSNLTNRSVEKKEDISFRSTDILAFYMKVISGMNSFNMQRMQEAYDNASVNPETGQLNEIAQIFDGVVAGSTKPTNEQIQFRRYIPLHLLAYASRTWRSLLEREIKIGDAVPSLSALFTDNMFNAGEYKQAVLTYANFLTNIEQATESVDTQIGLLGAFFAIKVGIETGRDMLGADNGQISDVYRKEYPLGTGKLNKEQKRDSALIAYLKSQGTVFGTLREEMKALSLLRNPTGGRKSVYTKFDEPIFVQELHDHLFGVQTF